MPTASTSKGELRRRCLVDAAVELLREGGISAIRHRAVAERAGVPLSATTYYFKSIDDLVASAIEHCSLHEHERMQGLVDHITVRRRGGRATAELLADLYAAPGGRVERDMLIARYERLTGSARVSDLRELQRGLARPYGWMLAEVLRKCRRRADPAGMAGITAIINGTILAGLLDTETDLRATTRDALLPVLDVYAPPLADGEVRGAAADPA
ncbi:TetR/AcrR family transcriptional regulator [Tomitella cavernea]|uniref:TetR family transcriptional regulator n=1 Tax=Tomitella cavernea TaxID=1387982 RepID=A0ABP9CF16_9ACTN|nr:TetR/AcrR family transcriptional regulator [Tomitella cavernea]